MLSTPFRAALKAAKARARSFRSVASTRPLWRRRDRLDSVARAHVERGLGGPPHGQVRERERGALDAGDEVGRILAARQAAVRRDQDLVVRDDAHERRDLSGARPDEAELLQTLEAERCERTPSLVDRHRQLQHEQPDDRASAARPARRRSCTATSLFRATARRRRRAPGAGPRRSARRHGVLAQRCDRGRVRDRRRGPRCSGTTSAHRPRV